MLTDNHSIIIDYPIDYNKFPLAKKCEFMEIELNEGEYVFIPENVLHWVFTDPYTIALSFSIKDIETNDINDNLYNKIKRKIPYKEKGKKVSIDYKNFINTYQNENFTVLYSDGYDSSPVYKPYETCKKFFDNDKLINIIKKNKKYGYYSYVGQHKMKENFSFLKEIKNFINIDDSLYLAYIPYLWLSINRPINSGLHSDAYDSLLYVLKGKKKVLLAKPNYEQYIYTSTLERIPHKEE